MRCKAALAALAALALLPAQAQQPVPEAALKAAFVFNFAVFTEWPAELLAAEAPLGLCLYPGNGLLPALAALGGKLVNGHRLSVHTLGAPGALRACHILFLERADRARWSDLRKQAGAGLLSVTDDRAIGNDGAVIALHFEHDRIGFDVDLAALRQTRLSLSSKLLRLARSVQ